MMKEQMSKRTHKTGLPPGTLNESLAANNTGSAFTVVDFSEEYFHLQKTTSIDACLKKRPNGAIRWINVEGIQSSKVLEQLGKHYGIHPLVLEDIQTTDERPKYEIYDEFVAVFVRMLFYDKVMGEVGYEQISLILGKDFVLSFTESEKSSFDTIVDRLDNKADRIRKMGADYLTYTLLDFVVDNYFDILEIFDEKIEVLEEKLIHKPSNDTLRVIHRLKRNMLFMHKSIWPLREVVGSLGRGETPLISESTFIYLRDLHDHVIQSMDTIDTMRDILSSLLDIYLSSVSKKMNEVMKVLTIFSTIFMPLTFIVGVYGMNFKFMPELNMKAAYPVLWVIMIVIAVSMIIFFKKKKWW